MNVVRRLDYQAQEGGSEGTEHSHTRNSPPMLTSPQPDVIDQAVEHERWEDRGESRGPPSITHTTPSPRTTTGGRYSSSYTSDEGFSGEGPEEALKRWKLEMMEREEELAVFSQEGGVETMESEEDSDEGGPDDWRRSWTDDSGREVGEDSDPEATEDQEDQFRCFEEEYGREMDADPVVFDSSELRELSSLMGDISITEDEEKFFEQCVEECDIAIQDALGHDAANIRDTRALEVNRAINQRILDTAKPRDRPTATTASTTTRSSQIIATAAELMAGGEEDHCRVTGAGAHDIMVRVMTDKRRKLGTETKPQAGARRRWDNKELAARREEDVGGAVGGVVGGGVGGTVQAHGRVIQGDGGYGRQRRTQAPHTPTEPKTENKEPAVSQEVKVEETVSRRNTEWVEPEIAQRPTVDAGDVGGQGDDEGGARGGARGNDQGVKQPEKGKKVGGREASQPRITRYFPPSNKAWSDEKSRGTDESGRNQ
jgi:hypothetical protein